MLILIEEITKVYGSGQARVEALKDVTVSIDKSDYIAVYGPSGSGKTTLLTIIAGLQHPSSGRVIVDDISIYDDLNDDGLARFRREYIGFVFQTFNLIPYLSAIENVMLPLAPLKKSKQKKREMAEEALTRVGMTDRAAHLPSELSGGQQQRTAIARALVNNPYILFADEPTGNLDTKTRNDIMDLFYSLKKDGHTIIMVTHDPDNIEKADKTIHISDGLISEN